MKTKIALRIILGIILLYAALQGWWIVLILLGTYGVWQFPFYIEIIFFGLAYDGLFSLLPASGPWGYAGTLSALAIVAIVSLLKQVVRGNI